MADRRSRAAFLYQWHGALVERLLLRPGLNLHVRAALGVVRWALDRIEMHKLRHGPSIGCPSCAHKGSICGACRAERKWRWG